MAGRNYYPGQVCYYLFVGLRVTNSRIGAGLVFVEGTAVTPEGRISPEDTGLWEDSQIASHEEIVKFAHSQGQKIGIQVCGSTLAIAIK
jgi:2,4-dienoyl-CoA reductase-like NADH-dependent reductase (Old Yellow Enzyme family)